MDSSILIFIIIVLSLIIGFGIGVMCFKIYNKRIENEIIKNAQEVLNSDRKNSIEIDGKEYDATAFIVRDEDDNEMLINLKGGTITKNGKESDENSRQQREETSTRGEHGGLVTKNSGSKRKKKRDVGKLRGKRRRFS